MFSFLSSNELRNEGQDVEPVMNGINRGGFAHGLSWREEGWLWLEPAFDGVAASSSSRDSVPPCGRALREVLQPRSRALHH